MENQSGKEKRFLSPTDAAIFLSLSKPTLDRLVRRKEIPSYKIGGRRLFDKEELVEWVKSKRNEVEESKASPAKPEGQKTQRKRDEGKEVKRHLKSRT